TSGASGSRRRKAGRDLVGAGGAERGNSGRGRRLDRVNEGRHGRREWAANGGDDAPAERDVEGQRYGDEIGGRQAGAGQGLDDGDAEAVAGHGQRHIGGVAGGDGARGDALFGQRAVDEHAQAVGVGRHDQRFIAEIFWRQNAGGGQAMGAGDDGVAGYFGLPVDV